MEDDLKILKVEYLCNYRSDLPQILNLSLEKLREMNLRWKMTSKY